MPATEWGLVGRNQDRQAGLDDIPDTRKQLLKGLGLLNSCVERLGFHQRKKDLICHM